MHTCRIQRPFLTYILLLTLFAMANACAWQFENGSWFSLLFLFTFYAGLCSGPLLATGSALVFSLYATFFSLAVLGAEFQVEFLFVIVIWNLVGFVVGKLSELNRTVHEQKEQLAESDELHRRILEASPNGIITTDLQGNIEFCSDRALRILDATRSEELLGRSAFDFIEPSQHEEALCNLERTIEDGSTHVLHYVTRTVGGTPFDAELSAAVLHDSRGEPKGFIGIMRDVTAENRLKRYSEERRLYLEGILASTPNAIVTLDEEHRVREWNGEAQRLFHYSPEEVRGRNIDSLLASGNEQMEEEAVSITSRVQRGSFVNDVETVRFTKEGEGRNVIVSAAPIIDSGGETIGYVGSYTDVSRLKRTERQLEDKRREVERLLEEKELLLHEVHHRIKNHMNTLYSILSVQMQQFDSAELREAIEEIKNRIRLMQTIYEKLYIGGDVDRIEIGSFMDQMIREIAYSFGRDSDVEIRSEVQDIHVSARQSLPIGIIINELVTNAYKYAFAAEADQKTGEAAAHCLIEVKISKAREGTLVIEVSDNGRGVGEHILRGEDYGFGLNLVEGYARQFDGEMQLQNNRDGGTRVQVSLQLEEYAASAGAEAEAGSGTGAGTGTGAGADHTKPEGRAS